MNTKEETVWHALLARSASTFAPSPEPPFGLSTRLLARLRDEQRQQDALERLGFRAIFASLAIVALTAAVTIRTQAADREDVDPGVKSMALVENLPVS